MTSNERVRVILSALAINGDAAVLSPDCYRSPRPRSAQHSSSYDNTNTCPQDEVITLEDSDYRSQ
jgi:hypothetical protein